MALNKVLASGRGNLLSARDTSRGVPLNMVNTSRRERQEMVNLAATQVTGGATDEITGAFAAVLKPGASGRKSRNGTKPLRSRASRGRSRGGSTKPRRRPPLRPSSSSAGPLRQGTLTAGSAVSADMMVLPDQVKNQLRSSWYRLRATVQSFRDVSGGRIALGHMYALCQQHLLGLDTEHLSSMLADAMGEDDIPSVQAQDGSATATAALAAAAATVNGADSGTSEAAAAAGAGNMLAADSIDKIEVSTVRALPALEREIQKQWDKVCRALSTMKARAAGGTGGKISLSTAQKVLLSHGVIITVADLCHLPDWAGKLSLGGNGIGNMSSRSQQLLLTARRPGAGNSERVESMLRDNIKRSWRRMNVMLRKNSTGRRGMVDMRQLNAVLSKFGVQLSHDDLVTAFSEFDEGKCGL